MTNPTHGADSEVGRLQTVMLHRPGDELKRLTPRNNDRLLFDGIPWVARAQDEHDAFAEALRDRDVEVLYLTELLTETLEQESARATTRSPPPCPGSTSATPCAPTSRAPSATRHRPSSRRTSPRASATTRCAAATGS